MTARYNSTAIALHWGVAAGILLLWGTGLYLSDLPLSPTRLKLINWHKWAGMTLWAFILFRLAWRLAHPAPALPAAMTRWERRASALTHILLYTLLVLIPLSGWLRSSAAGYPVVLFGVLPLPDLIEKSKAMAVFFKACHQWLNYTAMFLVVVHVAATFKHRLVDRIDILQRMLPEKRS